RARRRWRATVAATSSFPARRRGASGSKWARPCARSRRARRHRHHRTVMRGHWFDGRWVAGEGAPFESEDPATGRPCWSGRAASAEEVAAAVVAASKSGEEWRGRLFEDRARLLEAFATALGAHRRVLAEAISMEVGKPLW